MTAKVLSRHPRTTSI